MRRARHEPSNTIGRMAKACARSPTDTVSRRQLSGACSANARRNSSIKQPSRNPFHHV
jgi:hypothetical protein